MKNYLITALITTGLGLGFAPVANSQTSDTAEVEFTGTLAADCTVSNITSGTLGFPDAQTASSTGAEANEGSFDISEGCGTITLSSITSSTPDGSPFEATLVDISIGGSVVFEDQTAASAGSVSIGSAAPGEIRTAQVGTIGGNSLPLTSGDYSITVTATLTAN